MTHVIILYIFIVREKQSHALKSTTSQKNLNSFVYQFTRYLSHGNSDAYNQTLAEVNRTKISNMQMNANDFLKGYLP